MGEQNYSNHRRYIPGFHFFTYTLGIAVFVFAAIKVVRVVSEGQFLFSDLVYTGIMPLLIAIILLLILWYSRRFATKVQDRAIRAEENLRHFILTGKPFDHRLTMRQIVALRFAPDDEFRELARDAAEKSMSAEDIKKTIKNWKADHHRA